MPVHMYVADMSAMTYDPLWQTTTAAFVLEELTGTLPHAPPTSTPQNTVGVEGGEPGDGGGGAAVAEEASSIIRRSRGEQGRESSNVMASNGCFAVIS